MAITDSIYKTIFNNGDAISITSNGMYLATKGTYAGFTVGAGVTAFQLEFHPAVTITSAITLNGTNGTLIAGPCFDTNTNSADITLSGSGCSLITANGADLYGVVLDAAKTYFDGGGFGTQVKNTCWIKTTASDAIAHRFTGERITGNAVCLDQGTRTIWDKVKVTDSDFDGFALFTNDLTKVLESFVLDADSFGIDLDTNKAIIYGCNVNNPNNCISSNGDDNIICATIGRSFTFFFESGSSNNIASGNRIPASVVDSGTDNITSNNEAGAF
jgi:hypothetical protein